MKKIVVLLIFAIVLACNTTTKKPSTLIDYIPRDAQVIMKINNLEQTKNLLRDNSFIKNNGNVAFFKYFKNLPVLDQIHQPSGLLCFSPIGKSDFEFTYISKFDPSIIKKDSLHQKTIEAINYSNKTIHKVIIDDNTFFATQQDSILIASSSQLLIENAIRNQENKVSISADLQKAYEVSDTENPVSILLNGKELKNIHSSLLPNASTKGIDNFSGWISTDATITQNSILLDGIAIEKDSLSTTIGIFDNTVAQENQVAKLTPITAKGFISYTYDDFDIFKKNLALAQDREIEAIPTDLDEILSGVSEIGMIFLENETMLSLTSLEPENTSELLAGTTSESFRGITIYNYDNSDSFSKILTPLIPDLETNFYILYEDAIIFSPSRNGLQTMIANILNKTLLQEQEYYTNTIKKLSDESSILMISTVKNLKEYIHTNTEESYKKEWDEIKDKGYQIAALQVIKENNFAHIHSILQKNITKGAATSVTQTTATTLENKVLTTPTLVKNHRTKGMDVAVQDADNNLYLISDKGVIFWKKQINGAIIGDIQQIDIYKNGRYQLLFNTESTLYLLDRNGKDVASYPKKFEKTITQPISLFDYDKNKRYRIVITQGNELTMLDAEGKIVSGFGFRGTETTIILPPKHIRIGSKDYILISEENGKLNILDRLGRKRVSVKEKINFSQNQWNQYQNKFTSITKDGKFIQIPSDGSILLQDIDLKENSSLVATNKTLVTLSENKLSIKGKTLELDFGVYTKPQLFYIQNKIYVSITDIQANKVYLYDSNAELFPNFPVYGNSKISLGNMDKDPNLEFTVQGEDNSILIYQIN
ncbi:ribonuclease HII [Aquimarina sp. RZ0]|uniref:ribonuclease HII n=1 Tax=Aquimarina sp. RZ0 TaxID=2607730 RepID=UPI0011F198B6|nr:ribonuclease HII [Aquimarina sp. RZ0]KAA1242838.1 ribonuclease HII [Aquimarina sp. RZ0]